MFKSAQMKNPTEYHTKYLNICLIYLHVIKKRSINLIIPFNLPQRPQGYNMANI